MNCDQFRIAYLQDGSTQGAAGEHLAGCDDCPDAIAELDAIRAFLAEGVAWDEPSDDLEAAVVVAIAAEAEALGPRAAGEPAADDEAESAVLAATVSRVDMVMHAEQRARRSRRVAVFATVAAIAAVVLAGVAVVTRPASKGASESASVATNPPVEGASSTSTSTVGLPSGIDVSLSGTALAPGATGQARVTETTSGVRIYLDASGLQRLDNGQYYEAWLKGDRGLVPIGTFHTGADVTLWAGVSIDDYPMITVTIEDADGDQASSGRVVLAGTIVTGRPDGSSGPAGSLPEAPAPTLVVTTTSSQTPAPPATAVPPNPSP